MITNGIRLIQVVVFEDFYHLKHTHLDSESDHFLLTVPLVFRQEISVSQRTWHWDSGSLSYFVLHSMSCLVILYNSRMWEVATPQKKKPQKPQTNKTPDQANSNILVLCRLCKEFQANACSFLIPGSEAQPVLLQHLEDSPKTVYIQRKQISWAINFIILLVLWTDLNFKNMNILINDRHVKKKGVITWKKNNRYLRTISRFIPLSYSDQAARRRKDCILV